MAKEFHVTDNADTASATVTTVTEAEVAGIVEDAVVAEAITAVQEDDDFVADGTDGLEEGTIQEALQALATRVQALEDA